MLETFAGSRDVSSFLAWRKKVEGDPSSIMPLVQERNSVCYLEGKSQFMSNYHHSCSRRSFGAARVKKGIVGKIGGGYRYYTCGGSPDAGSAPRSLGELLDHLGVNPPDQAGAGDRHSNTADRPHVNRH
jgi:hypothetical protein